MIRRLYLENTYGNRFYFDYRSGCLISGLSGLGFSKELTYLKYDQFYDRVDQTQPLLEIQAILTFLKGYLGYSQILDYLKLSSKSLKLVYQTFDQAFCYVEIKSLSKQELVSGVLQCQITFQKLSLWLKELSSVIEVNVELFGKVYPFIYPYQYSASFEGKISIQNRGVIKAPLLIEMIGAVNDPEVTIIKDGNTLSTLRLYHNAEEGTTVISSLPTNQYMHQIIGDETISVYDKQDFTCENFLFVEPGEYEIEFKPGVASPTLCRITMLEGYLGV